MDSTMQSLVADKGCHAALPGFLMDYAVQIQPHAMFTFVTVTNSVLAAKPR